MTGYNDAHGDTQAVKLNLANNADLYRDYMKAVSLAEWDTTTSRWLHIDRAADAVRAQVAHLAAQPRRPETGEIHDAHLDDVDYTELVALELNARNLDAGRPADAGLPH